ncbi:MAG: hypothetical protein ACFE9I_14055 [Candidatus Hermodarchaeota archaeon]
MTNYDARIRALTDKSGLDPFLDSLEKFAENFHEPELLEGIELVRSGKQHRLHFEKYELGCDIEGFNSDLYKINCYIEEYIGEIPKIDEVLFGILYEIKSGNWKNNKIEFIVNKKKFDLVDFKFDIKDLYNQIYALTAKDIEWRPQGRFPEDFDVF